MITLIIWNFFQW